MAQQTCWPCAAAPSSSSSEASHVSSTFAWDGGTRNARAGSQDLRPATLALPQLGAAQSFNRWLSETRLKARGRADGFIGFSIVHHSSSSSVWGDSVFASWMPGLPPGNESRKCRIVLWPLALAESVKSRASKSHFAKPLRRWLLNSRTQGSPLVPKVAKKKAQMVVPDAVTVESGKYSYDVESAINQLSALAPRASVARCMDSYRNKLSMKDFSLIFREFAQRGDWQRALKLFKYMQRQQWCKPHEYIYTILIGILGREGLLDKCSDIFEDMPNNGVEWNVYSFTALINAYGRNGQYEASLHLLSRMKRERVTPNLITYNTVINACAKGGLEWEGLLGLFAQMRHEGIQPDIITYNTLLSACSSRGLVEEAKMVFRTMNEAGVVPDMITYTSLVETYGGAGHLEVVVELLREMEDAGNVPDVMAYNVLLEAYAKIGDVSGAAGVFMQMLQAGCRPSVSTYSTLLECYGKHGSFDDVRELFADMKASGTAPDVVTYNTLIHVFGTGGYFREAINLFRDMLDGNVEPDMGTYRGLLQACGTGGLYEEAQEIYRHLMRRGLTPVSAVFEGLINAFGNAALYQEAEISFNSIEEQGCQPNHTLFNTLIQAYSRGGLYKEAGGAFLRMHQAGFSTTVDTFNALIDAYGKGGLFDDAREVFSDMKEAGCSPNLQTYEALLNVYCTAGLFDEAKAQFLEMKEGGMAPEVTSYCLMLSICARRSRWDDAFKLLEEMQGSNMLDLHIVIAGLIQGNFDEDSNWEQIVQPTLDNINMIGVGSNIVFYNALLDALWWSGQRQRAVRVLQEGRKRGIFPEAFRKTKRLWSVDVHRMSVGAALTTLLVWLGDLQLAATISEDLPRLFSIITRRTEFNEEDEPDVPVSKAVYSTLDGMGVPFKFAPWNQGRIISFRTLLMPWLEESTPSETFLVNTPLSIPHPVVKLNDSNFPFGRKKSRSKQLTTI